MSGGRGDSPGNLERIRGPVVFSEMLIGTGSPLRPKRTTPPGCLETTLGSVNQKSSGLSGGALFLLRFFEPPWIHSAGYQSSKG